MNVYMPPSKTVWQQWEADKHTMLQLQNLPKKKDGFFVATSLSLGIAEMLREKAPMPDLFICACKIRDNVDLELCIDEYNDSVWREFPDAAEYARMFWNSGLIWCPRVYRQDVRYYHAVCTLDTTKRYTLEQIANMILVMVRQPEDFKNFNSYLNTDPAEWKFPEP